MLLGDGNAGSTLADRLQNKGLFGDKSYVGNTDYNELTTLGMYLDALGNNRPADWCIILVFPGGGSVIQLAFASASLLAWIRKYTQQDGWSAWKGFIS